VVVRDTGSSVNGLPLIRADGLGKRTVHSGLPGNDDFWQRSITDNKRFVPKVGNDLEPATESFDIGLQRAEFGAGQTPTLDS
jgi:hypothetical protein